MSKMSTDNINVVVRARPLYNPKKFVPWVIDEKTIYQICEDKTPLGDKYSYDEVYGTTAKNCDIYRTSISSFTKCALEGINLTIFAYGATSSGKTYTMNGTRDDPGIIPRFIEDIFDQVESCNDRKFLISVSYVEIYSEIINDLLDKSNKDLKIREDVNNCVSYNPTEKIVKSCAECMKVMELGSCNRTVGETNMNLVSSRSHSIFRIVIESAGIVSGENDPVQVSHVNLIDLAGSERVSQTGATGQRFKEGAHINKSLTSLGLVIKQLVEKKDYVNYRDSKLTRILSNSLGGNAKTLIICNINLECTEDTASTLMFAQRAKAVKNKPTVNEIITEAALTKRYAKECSEIKKLLEMEFQKNKELEEETKASRQKMEVMQLQLKTYEEKFVKKGTKMKPPKRRYTISTLDAISEEKELDKNSRSLSASSRGHLGTDKNGGWSDDTNIVNPLELTPPKSLRTRFESLKRDHEELVEFTKYEESFHHLDNLRIKKLENDCCDLRFRLEKAQNGSKQIKIDYEVLLENQKKKFERRESELVEQLNRCSQKTETQVPIFIENVPIPKTPMNEFEYEEMLEKISSIDRQNQELTNNLRVVELDKQELSVQVADLKATMNALELQNAQLKIKNKSLQSKMLDMEIKISDSNHLADSSCNEVETFKKKIFDYESETKNLKSEIEKIESMLFESQDKLLNITQDLDSEEEKSSRLEKELVNEKKLHDDLKCKYLSDTKLREQLESQLLSEKKLRIEIESKLFSENKLREEVESKLIKKNEMLQEVQNDLFNLYNILTSGSELNGTIKQHSEYKKMTISYLEYSTGLESSNIDKEESICEMTTDNLEQFSSSFFQDPDKSNSFMNYFISAVGKEDGVSVTPQTEISQENMTIQDCRLDEMKKQLDSAKLQIESDTLAIKKLQTQLEENISLNMCDSEKLNNINKILEAEKVKYLKIIQELKEQHQNDLDHCRKLQNDLSFDIEKKEEELIALNKNNCNQCRIIEELNTKNLTLTQYSQDQKATLDKMSLVINELKMEKNNLEDSLMQNDLLPKLKEKEEDYSKQYEETIRMMNINIDGLKSENEKLEEINRKLQNDLLCKIQGKDALNSEFQIMSQKVDDLSDENDKLKKYSQDQNATLDEMGTIINELRNEKKILEDKNSLVQNDLSKLKEKEEQYPKKYEESVKIMNMNIDDLKNENKNLEEINRKLQNDLISKMKGKEEELIALNSKVQILSQNIDDFRDENDKLKKYSENQKETIDKLSMDINELKLEKENLENTNDKLQRDLSSKLKEIEELLVLISNNQTHLKKNEELCNENDSLKQYSKDQKEIINKMEVKINELDAEKKKLEDMNTKLNNDMLLEIKQKDELIDLLRKNQSQSKNIEKLFEENEKLKKCAKFQLETIDGMTIKINDLGTDKKNLEDIIDKLQSDLELKMKEHVALKSENEVHSKKIDLLNNENETLRKYLEDQRKTIDEMNIQINKLRTEKNELGEMNTKLNNDLLLEIKQKDELIDLIRKNQSQLKNSEELFEENEKLKKCAKFQQETIDGMTIKINDLGTDKKKLEDIIDKLQSDLELKMKEHVALKSENEVHLKKIDLLNNENGTSRKYSEDQRKTIDEMNIEINKLRAEKSELKEMIHKLQDNLSSMKKEKEEDLIVLNEKNQIQSKKIDHLNNEHETLRKNSEDQKKTINEMWVEINKLKTEKTNFEDMIDKLKNNLSLVMKEKEDELIALNKRNQSQSINIENLKKENEELKQYSKSQKNTIDKMNSQINEFKSVENNIADMKFQYLKEKKETFDKLSMNITELKAEKKNLEEMNNKLQNEFLSKMKEKDKELIASTRTIQNQSKVIAEFETLKNYAEKQKEYIDRMNIQMNELKIEKKNLEEMNSKCERKLKNGESIVKQLESDNQKQKAELSFFRTSIKNLDEEHKKKISEYENNLLQAQEKLKTISLTHEKDVKRIENLEYELMKKTKMSSNYNHNGDKNNSESKNTEDKWKQQRNKAHDSRRSIDLDTICSESRVENCHNCDNMNKVIHKMKYEIEQLKADSGTLKIKYEKLKMLCKMRGDEILQLKKT